MKVDRYKAELEKIRIKNNGILSPEDVVNEAKTNSILHDYFDWDDKKASHEWRLEQARKLIRVCVQMIETSAGKIPLRVYVSLKGDRKFAGGGYRLMSSVLGDENSRRLLLVEALDEMNVFVEKYRQLKELEPIFTKVKEIKKKLGKK